MCSFIYKDFNIWLCHLSVLTSALAASGSLVSQAHSRPPSLNSHSSPLFSMDSSMKIRLHSINHGAKLVQYYLLGHIVCIWNMLAVWWWPVVGELHDAITAAATEPPAVFWCEVALAGLLGRLTIFWYLYWPTAKDPVAEAVPGGALQSEKKVNGLISGRNLEAVFVSSSSHICKSCTHLYFLLSLFWYTYCWWYHTLPEIMLYTFNVVYTPQS